MLEIGVPIARHEAPAAKNLAEQQEEAVLPFLEGKVETIVITDDPGESG